MASIEVLESFIQGKQLPAECEDALLLSSHHVGVFDGMSSPLAKNSERTGRLFAKCAEQACRTLPAESTAMEVIPAVTSVLANLSVHHAGPFGAVGAVYSVARREIWRVGDVHVRINGEHFPGTKEVDSAMSAFRAAFNSAILANDPEADLQQNDRGLAAVTPLLEVQGYLANHVGPFGYGVLNGDDIPTDLIEVMPVSAGDEVVLATDGYLTAAPSLAQAEDELRAAQERDPLAIGELQSMAKCLRPHFHSHDDRTYLRFRAL